MSCRNARHLLSRDLDRKTRSDPALARHLAGCDDCRRFAERWAETRRDLRQHRARLTPDAGFAARVVARLDPPADPFAWAARRLLPATLALTLVLTGWALLRTPAPASLAEELADGDLITWVASGGEEDR